jgi:hypothetical protein
MSDDGEILLTYKSTLMTPIAVMRLFVSQQWGVIGSPKAFEASSWTATGFWGIFADVDGSFKYRLEGDYSGNWTVRSDE